MNRNYGERVFTYIRETGSTNDDLKKMLYASDGRLFNVLSADKQTGGRGRRGRTFLSPDGGIYFSAVYPLTGHEKNIPFLTLAAGLAVAESIDGMSDSRAAGACEIKWPNDIYINGRKACGILTELVNAPSGLAAVVGIGINTAKITDVCPEELKDKITSLNDEGIFPERGELIEKIITRLDRYVYVENVLDGASEKVIGALNRRSYLAGKEIEFFDGNEKRAGKVLSVEPDGSLAVRTPDGDISVRFGEVTVSLTSVTE